MRIIEIKALPNGAHFNQTSDISEIPEGYAQIPDDMVIPSTFPFVNIKVAEETRYKEVKHYPIEVDEETEDEEPIIEHIPYTVTVVTSMTEGVVPEPAPEPIPEPTTDEILDVLLGVADDE
ncbi:MAG: hypothetical protein IKV53_07235 [Clostridia bacterium]|nr:hypothetical protein [Clostridia bacterium]